MSGPTASSSKASSSSNDATPYPPVSRQRKLDVALTTVQNASAGAFGAFMFVHLAAPIAASLGGEASASNTMLIGRELYQTQLGEKALLASGVLHVSASTAKRFLATRRAGRFPALRSLSWHTLTGYALVPMVAYHTFKHRWRPLALDISPAFLDFGYVVRGLQVNPVFTWLGYGSIVLVGVYHCFAGIRKIVSQGRKRAILHDKPYKVASAAVVGSVGLGLVSLALEDKLYPPALLAKWDSVL